MKKKNVMAILSTILLSTIILGGHVSADGTVSTESQAVENTPSVVTIEETKPVTDSLTNTEAPVTDNAGTPSATPEIASNSIATSSAEEATTPVVENNATPQLSEESTTTEDNTLTILHTNDMHGRIVEESSVIGTPKLAEIAEENRQQGNNPSAGFRRCFPRSSNFK